MPMLTALQPGQSEPAHARAPVASRRLHAVEPGNPTAAIPSSPSKDGGRRSGVRSTATGAQFDPLLEFEAWKRMGTRLGVYTTATAWWLGDWLTFGRHKYGRRYKDAVAATGLDYQTLRNYAVVARRFTAARRRANLTFQHHAVVCALPDDEQDEWLDRAAAGGWSRNELRRRLRAAALANRSRAEEIVRLAVARERAERWRQAAERRRCSCESWIVSVLDAAATTTLAGSAG